MIRLVRWHRAVALLTLLLTPMVSGEFCLGAESRVDAVGDPLPKGFRFRLGTTRLQHWFSAGTCFTPDGKQLLSIRILLMAHQPKRRRMSESWLSTLGSLGVIVVTGLLAKFANEKCWMRCRPISEADQ